MKTKVNRKFSVEVFRTWIPRTSADVRRILGRNGRLVSDGGTPLHLVVEFVRGKATVWLARISNPTIKGRALTIEEKALVQNGKLDLNALSS